MNVIRTCKYVWLTVRKYSKTCLEITEEILKKSLNMTIDLKVSGPLEYEICVTDYGRWSIYTVYSVINLPIDCIKTSLLEHFRNL
jgi:hypothetical protein